MKETKPACTYCAHGIPGPLISQSDLSLFIFQFIFIFFICTDKGTILYILYILYSINLI